MQQLLVVTRANVAWTEIANVMQALVGLIVLRVNQFTTEIKAENFYFAHEHSQ